MKTLAYLLNLLVVLPTIGLSQTEVTFRDTSTASTPTTSAPAFGNEDLQLIEGEVRTLGPFDATRVAVGDGKLLQLQHLQSGEVLLIGKNKGTTSLRVWLQNGKQLSYRVNITDKQQAQDITMKKIISMHVKIIEFRESSLKKIGIDWSKTAAGPSFFLAKDFISTVPGDVIQSLNSSSLNPVGNRSSTPLFLGSNTALNSTISMMQSAGHASSLASPTLSCLSGESAEFLAGGEIPFPTIGENGAPAVAFKDYGIKLKLTPHADRHGRVSTSISTEVSRIDSSVSVNGAPGFITRKTNTHMNVMTGQTIVIAGLLTKDSAKDIDYIPGLGNLPIIGQSFQTQTMSASDTHLVIFLTPYIFDPTDSDTAHTGAVNKDQLGLSGKSLASVLTSGLADINVQIGEQE